MNRLLLAVVGLLLSHSVVAAEANVPAAPDPSWGAPLQWARFAEVSTLPGLQGIALLNDGDPKTSGLWCTGAEGSGELTVRFPQPIAVTMFRFLQSGNAATKYRLTADLRGQGGYEECIKEQTNEKPIVGKFIAIPVGQRVFGLKFTALEGKSSYRAPFPTLAEVEIYSKDPTPEIAAAVCTTTDPRLLEVSEKALPEFKRKEIDIRLCIDTWNAGIQRKKDAGNLAESKTFQEMVKRFKDADANSARLFIETACCDDEMPWKSETLWPGHGVNQLAPLAAALHANGLKLYFFSHAWMSPFQERDKRAKMPYCRWDYPYEQSDRLIGVMNEYQVRYPCVISDNGFRDNWLEFLKEALKQGVDGVYLTPDEYYFKGHNLSVADCPQCTAEFKAMYGYDTMPRGASFSVGDAGATKAVKRGKIEDSEKYRKWKLFEYNKIAGLFHYVSSELKKMQPTAQIVMSDNKVTEDLSGRLEHNMCLDLMENDPNCDLAQMYGSAVLLPVGRHSAYSRRIAAAAGSRDKLLASIQWLGIYNSLSNLFECIL